MATARAVALFLAAIVLAIGATAALALLTDRPERVRGTAEERSVREALAAIEPRDIVPVLERDAIAAIDNPVFVPAPEAELPEGDFVIGVALAGEARAYPVRVLSAHEIVNDVIGVTPIAVTWCPLCHSALVYDRAVGRRTLSFGVSGKLYRNSLVMYDRETESLWSHLLGGAIDGPLQGEQLQTLPSAFTSWGEWRETHSDTSVLAPGASPYGVYGEDPYAGYYATGRRGVLGVERDDSRLEPKELVLAVLAPAAKAYAFRDVERAGHIEDTLAGELVEVIWNSDAKAPEAFVVEGRARRPLPATPVFWFAWVDIFPGAPLWARPSPTSAPSAG